MPQVHDTQKEARKTLEGLRAERDRVETRVAEIAAEREKVAPAALAGDKAASDLLAALKEEAGELGDHLTDVSSAIAQAERDVSAAQDAVTAYDDREVAKRHLALADQIEAAAQEAFDGHAKRISAIRKINEAADELRRSGGTIAGDRHMKMMIERSLLSDLIDAGLAQATIPHSSRKSLTVLIGEYAAGARQAARQRISAANAIVGHDPAPVPGSAQPAKEPA